MLQMKKVCKKFTSVENLLLGWRKYISNIFGLKVLGGEIREIDEGEWT